MKNPMKNLMALVLFLTLALPISNVEAAKPKHKKNSVHQIKSKKKRKPSSEKKKKSKKKIKKSKKKSSQY